MTMLRWKVRDSLRNELVHHRPDDAREQPRFENSEYIRPLAKLHGVKSLLDAAAMSITRRPKRFLWFLYLSATILERFTAPMTCSVRMQSLEMARLFRWSSVVSGFFLLRFVAHGGVVRPFL